MKEIYEIMGDDLILKLVNTFYDKIDMDDLLRPMFPINLKYAREFQYLFLKQVFGGPREYNELRGKPMMRLRHAPFKIGITESNRWMKLMSQSMDELNITGKLRSFLDNYFKQMAARIINEEQRKKLMFNMK